MKRAIIGCEILKQDIGFLIDELPYEADVIWLDQKLHDFPERLRLKLQETIDALKDCDEIILTYLLCGNALAGIKSDTSVIRFIKGDDCIYADLCCREDYKQLRKNSFFVSHSWLGTERNVIREYERAAEKYGEDMARNLWAMMYNHYKYLVYMKLTEEEDQLSEKESLSLAQIAEYAGLEIKTVKGSLDMYRLLFSLKDDPRIAVIEKGRKITPADAMPPKV